MPPKKGNFGRGHSRGSNRKNPPIPQSAKDKNLQVQIKHEKLHDIGHIVSPDRSKTTFTIKRVLEILRQQDNTKYQEPELKQMLTTWRKYKGKSTKDIQSMSYTIVVQELQMIQKRLLGDDDYEYTIDEVVAILTDKRNRSAHQLQNMKTEELKQMLTTWKTHNHKDTDSVKDMIRTDIILALENIKLILTSETLEKTTSEIIMEEVDRETDMMFQTVSEMDVNKHTTNDEIKKFSQDQLAVFQYVKSLKMKTFPSLEEVQQINRENLIKYCQKWRDTEKKKSTDDQATIMSLEDEDEEDLYSSPISTGKKVSADIHQEDVVMTDVEDDDESEREETTETDSGKVDGSNIQPYEVEDPVLLESKEAEKLEEVFDEKNDDEKEIHLLTDTEITQLKKHQLVNIYYNHSLTTSQPMGKPTLDLWTEDLLRKAIRNARDTLKREQRLSIKLNQQGSSLKPQRKYAGKPKIQSDLQNNTFQSWRYNLFFTQPQDISTMDDLRQYLGDLFHEMKKYQPNVKLLPWSTTDMKDSIEDSETLPTTITGLKKYFPNVRAPTGVLKQYIKIRIGLPIQKDRLTFEADYGAWCNTKNVRMYYCSVQHPHTKIIGWLVYAPNTVDREKWCRATQETYSQLAKDGSTISVGLSWKALAGQWEVQAKEKVYAMHIETTIALAPKVKTFLRMISQRKIFPLGVRFRVMDQYTKYMKETTLVKYKYILDKHKTCLKELRRYESGKILNLDYRLGNTKLTLRDVVVQIRDNDDGRRIFNSIDARYDRPDIHVAMYRPDKAAKAEAFMDSLPTYIRHLYPDISMSRIFTIEAMELAENSEYYPNTQTFLTQEDIELDKEIQMDWDDDSFEHLKAEGSINPFEITLPVKLPGGTKLYDFSGDDETASTIPATSSNLTFTNNSIHLYDATSTVSGMSALSDINKQIKHQINKLNADTTVTAKEDQMEEANKA